MKFRVFASVVVLVVIGALYWFSEQGGFGSRSVSVDDSGRQSGSNVPQPNPQDANGDDSFKRLKVN